MVAMSAPPDSAEHWLQVGQALRSQQRWTEAADACRQAIAREPDNANAWFILGMSEVNANHYDAAEQAYQQCLTLAPGNVVSEAGIGSLSDETWIVLIQAESL